MNNILYEKGDYYILKSQSQKGYEVYKNGVTHSTRVGVIGFDGDVGLQKAKAEIDRRINSKIKYI